MAETKKAEKTQTVEEAVRDFVGEVKNLHKIDVHKIWNDKYRVNVWTQHFGLERVVATNHIYASYFIEYKDNKLVDRTLRK